MHHSFFLVFLRLSCFLGGRRSRALLLLCISQQFRECKILVLIQTRKRMDFLWLRIKKRKQRLITKSLSHYLFNCLHQAIFTHRNVSKIEVIHASYHWRKALYLLRLRPWKILKNCRQIRAIIRALPYLHKELLSVLGIVCLRYTNRAFSHV